MFCARCGRKIPNGADRCTTCGWQKTMEHNAILAIKSMKATSPKRNGSRAGITAGLLGAGLSAGALFLIGAALLFHYRGFAGEIWKSTPPPSLATKGSRPVTHLMQLRNELLSLSAEISGIDRGAPYNSVKIARRLEEIKKEISQSKNDPLYFKVLALEKSVEFQLKLSSPAGFSAEIPPLPYTTFVNESSEEYVMKDISTDSLIKNRVLLAGNTSPIRYGPALMSFPSGKKVFSDLFDLDAPRGYRYVEVVVQMEGEIELVEYSTRMLDDYKRAFTPLLGAEKEARQHHLSRNHFFWRDVSKITRDQPVYLHRIFLLPADAITKPILEIKRQGASRMLWIQY